MSNRTTAKRIAIGYVRVSTEEQATEGVSLDAQRQKFMSYCQLNDLEPMEACSDEGISGKRMDNRPGLQAALFMACRYKAVLVVYSLSRMARNTRETLEVAERLERSGADLVSISERIETTSAAGKMVFRMMAVLAEFERDQVAERTRLALSYKRSRGERVGCVPYGYVLGADGVKLTPEPGEQVIVGMIHSLRRGEGYSYRQIADALNESGVPTKGGRPWQFSTVKSILRRG